MNAVKDRLRAFIWWWQKHIQGVCLWLALILVCLVCLTTTVVRNYLDEQALHVQLHYDNALMKWLLIDRDCTCEEHRNAKK